MESGWGVRLKEQRKGGQGEGRRGHRFPEEDRTQSQGHGSKLVGVQEAERFSSGCGGKHLNA